MQDDKESGADWVFKSGSDEPSNQNTPDSSESFEDGSSDTAGAAQSANSGGFVSWSASEYVSNPKDMNWFVGLGVSTLVLAVLVYFITKDYISTGVIVTLGITVGVFAARKPNTLQYRVDTKGIQIGEKSYPYGVFRAFSVASDGPLSFISLAPLKRFMPPISIHYEPKDADKIMDVLGNHLPYEEHKHDIVDNISRRVRF